VPSHPFSSRRIFNVTLVLSAGPVVGMRSGLVVLNQPFRLQAIKDALRLLRLHAQLESYLLDWREDATICRSQTPEID
jgi:hypothetical protein